MICRQGFEADWEGVQQVQKQIFSLFIIHYFLIWLKELISEGEKGVEVVQNQLKKVTFYLNDTLILTDVRPFNKWSFECSFLTAAGCTRKAFYTPPLNGPE